MTRHPYDWSGVGIRERRKACCRRGSEEGVDSGGLAVPYEGGTKVKDWCE